MLKSLIEVSSFLTKPEKCFTVLYIVNHNKVIIFFTIVLPKLLEKRIIFIKTLIFFFTQLLPELPLRTTSCMQSTL